MEKNKVLGIGILLTILIVAGSFVYSLFLSKKSDELDKTDNLSQITIDTLHLEYEYKEDNRWEYTVTGTLPNFCYSISTESIVMESYPEQVTVKSTIKHPGIDEVCPEAIQEIFQHGEFEASPEAKVSFQVV